MVILICMAGMLAGCGAAVAGALIFDPGLLGMLLAYSVCGSLGCGFASVGLAARAGGRAPRRVPAYTGLDIPSR